MITQVGSSVFLGVSHTRSARGRYPSSPQIWGFHSIYADTLWRRTTEFDAGMWLVLGISHAPPRGGIPGLLRTKVYSAFHPSGSVKMSTSCGWEGKGRYGSFRLWMNVWVCR